MASLPGRRFDLHLHSCRSDGRLQPEALIEACAAGGLDVVALTDHDLTSEVAHGPRTIGGHTITVLAGAEVSGVHEGMELHLLVWFPSAPPERFRAFCAERCRERAERYAAAIRNLALPGLEAPDAQAIEGQRSLTRTHLAQALVRAGHAPNLSEAFRTYAGDAHGYVPPFTLAFTDAIRIAREAGGVTSWAHPSLLQLRRHLGTFVAAGLQGIEVERPALSGSDKKAMRKLAREHGIFVTGGSDWHGTGPHGVGLFHVDRSALGGFLAALQASAQA